MKNKIPTLKNKVATMAKEKIKFDNCVEIPEGGFGTFKDFFPALSHTLVRLGLGKMEAEIDSNAITLLTNICIAQQNQIEKLNNKVKQLCIRQHLQNPAQNLK